MQIAVHTDIHISQYLNIQTVAIWISVLVHIHICKYPYRHVYGDLTIPMHCNIDSNTYSRMTNRTYGYTNLSNPFPNADFALRDPILPCYGIAPLFCFVLGKLCFCTYSPRTSAVPTKTNLPRNSPAPLERVCTRVGKRSQLPFSPAMRTIPPSSGEHP